MDWQQRAEELENVCYSLLYQFCVTDQMKRAFLLKIDCAGMDEEELINEYGDEAAELIAQGKYYDASISLERNKNEGYC